MSPKSLGGSWTSRPVTRSARESRSYRAVFGKISSKPIVICRFINSAFDLSAAWFVTVFIGLTTCFRCLHAYWTQVGNCYWCFVTHSPIGKHMGVRQNIMINFEINYPFSFQWKQSHKNKSRQVQIKCEIVKLAEYATIKSYPKGWLSLICTS